MVRKKSITKTKALELINAFGYSFYTVTWKTKAGETKTVNCCSKKNSQSKLGYIRANVPGQGMKSIDPRTISELKIKGEFYKVK